MRALALATRVRLRRKPPFERRQHRVDERVLDHPISERQRRDHPARRLVDHEPARSAGSILTSPKLAGEPGQCRRRVQHEARHIRSPTLSCCGSFGHDEQMFQGWWQGPDRSGDGGTSRLRERPIAASAVEPGSSPARVLVCGHASARDWPSSRSSGHRAIGSRARAVALQGHRVAIAVSRRASGPRLGAACSSRGPSGRA